MSKPSSSPSPLSRRLKYFETCLPPDQGAMAPAPRLRSSSGTTRLSSTCRRVPMPSQVGQAPKGELKENERGSISSIVSGDRKSTRLNSSHVATSYAVFCLKKKQSQ